MCMLVCLRVLGKLWGAGYLKHPKFSHKLVMTVWLTEGGLASIT